MLDKIRKALVNRVLSELKNRAKDAEEFKNFQENFGEILKHGHLRGYRPRRRNRRSVPV